MGPIMVLMMEVIGVRKSSIFVILNEIEMSKSLKVFGYVVTGLVFIELLRNDACAARCYTSDALRNLDAANLP